jgi:hypothetical protein
MATDNDLPWLWLEHDPMESERVAGCGCRLVRDHRDSGDPAFQQCALHAAAGTLRLLLERRITLPDGDPQEAELLNQARALLQKIQKES